MMMHDVDAACYTALFAPTDGHSATTSHSTTGVQHRHNQSSDELAGYKFNITFLRNFLAPIYEIHDLKQNPDNEFEILARWSFSMQFWWLRYLPFIKASSLSPTTVSSLTSSKLISLPTCKYLNTYHILVAGNS